jgi:hypothetical protein
MNKKFYTCTTAWDHDPKFKIYDSINELKYGEPCWAECGIYEVILTASRCIVEPSTFFDVELTNLDNRDIDEQDICGEETSEIAKDFVEKFIQPFKKKKKVDWADSSGNKEFKWSGTCDACSDHKSNLTVIHSATLGGVTICRECRMGALRD